MVPISVKATILLVCKWNGERQSEQGRKSKESVQRSKLTQSLTSSCCSLPSKNGKVQGPYNLDVLLSQRVVAQRLESADNPKPCFTNAQLKRRKSRI
ncbi:hypothetical protein DdX_05500 [Ditylenchus destructor]|uniref:Uncharacterized protein n=1 Tax=Ditylenchus destructor TaxID=166010 RepID=A0AAD4N9C9_9BILA|nr:hypothetical protein DdX_05500 [Ditylenchus destructor]